MWQRLGVLRYFLALMEAQRALGAAPGAANVRFRVHGEGWDRTMSRSRFKYELGQQYNAFNYLEQNEQNAAALVAY